MNIMSARQFILDALDRATASGIRSPERRAAFLAGTDDIRFDEIEMDSLARMELCIAIELKSGIELPSERLDEIGTLARLAEMLEK